MTNGAVNNGHLHEEVRERLAESRSLQRVAAALLQRLSLEEVFETVRREARYLTGAAGDGIYLVEEEA